VKTICLISLLSLAGCKTINEAPITTFYVIDVDHNICSKRLITDKSTLASKWLADLPLETCDGIIGLSSKEFLNLRTYMKGN
jgi:hypothetical protein